MARAQAALYEEFAALHRDGTAFIMPNAWDASSALILRELGFRAIGSSSLAIALSLGRPDGRGAVTRSEAIQNASLLSVATGLPVNGDLEDGFGAAPADCATTVEAAIEAGLAGLGIEDTTGDPSQPLHGFDAAVRRIQAATAAARGRIFLTARTDNFLHGVADIDETVRKLVAFAEAGADAVFAPGVTRIADIRAIARAVSPVPVAVVAGLGEHANPLEDLDEAGVRRVSTGGALYRKLMGHLASIGSELRAGRLTAVYGGMPASELESYLPAAPRDA